MNPGVCIKQCVIDKNTYQIGPTVLLHERAILFDEISGHPDRVSVSYDIGATDSLCNESIGNLGKKMSSPKQNLEKYMRGPIIICSNSALSFSKGIQVKKNINNLYTY